MNKLIIPNGGMALHGDDFRFIDAANRDAFKGILFEFLKPYDGNVVLGGCDFSVSGNVITITEGYIAIDYEVCYFPGGNFNVPPGNPATGVYSLDTTFDPAGSEVFANATTQDTYQIRRAKFTVATTSGSFLDAPGVRLSSAIYAALSGFIASTQSFVMQSSWAKATGLNAPFLYKQNRFVSLVGDFTPGTIVENAATLITVLPAAFRPVKNVRTIVAAQTSVPSIKYGNILIEVFTNGQVYAMATSSDTWDIVSINLCYISS